MRYVRLFWKLKCADIQSGFQFRTNFFLEIIGTVSQVLVWLIGVKFAMERYGDIGGWSFSQILLLISLFFLSWSIASVFCIHVTDLVMEVREGRFIKYMLRPMPPLFYYVSDKFPLRTVGGIFSSLLLFIWALANMEFSFSFTDVLFVAYVIIGGAAMIAGSFLLNSALAFFDIDTSSSFENVLNVAREMSRFPLFIYPWYLKFLLLVIIPYGFVAYIPIHYILKMPLIDIPHAFMMLSPALGFVYLFIMWNVWNIAMQRFSGTGS